MTQDIAPNFERIVNPATVPIGNRPARLWVRVKWRDGRLSITGVEGPLVDGDARGSAGQCGVAVDATPAEGWTRASLDTLRGIWTTWHLNDMRPYNAAMAAAGWPEQAQKVVLGYEFAQAAGRPHKVRLWAGEHEPEPAAPAGMARARHTYGPWRGDVKAPERKTLGWLRPSEHPDGLLGRKLHPDDAAGYGGKWWREDVPSDVLRWLQDMPEPAKGLTPAWV